MKLHFLIIAAFFIIIFSQVSKAQLIHPDKTQYELKPNDSVGFGDEKRLRYKTISASYQCGAYDGTKFNITLDSMGLIEILELNGSRNLHQNEFIIHQCQGEIIRKEDTLFFNLTSKYKSLYLFNIKHHGIVDSFGNHLKISVTAVTMNNTYCPLLLTTHNSNANIIALPKNIKTKAIYKAKHKKEEVGVFNYFEVIDDNGNIKKYPADDYVLIGGDALLINY